MSIGTFDPVHDLNAALKICIDSLFLDKRFDDLAALLSDASKVDELQGEPGWSLQVLKTDIPGITNEWPNEAEVRAEVDPNVFSLTHSDFYCTKQELRNFIKLRIETSPAILHSEAYKMSRFANMVQDT